MTTALAGASAVVTGGSRGIGLAIAQSLAGAGARVAMLARSRGALEEGARAIGERAVAIVCDLADADDVERALGEIRTSLGAPDILVNNAGAFALATVGAMPLRDVERMIDVNLLAPYAFANAFVPDMRARGSGHVVTIGSIADRQTFPENAAYAAGKFGARAMHQVMRDELRGSGVRVSLVSPGPVDTPLWDPIGPDVRPGFTPRNRMLRAQSVADAVLWTVTLPADVNVDELRLTRS
ncbi:MAG: SDR family oxidoreductase [Gemmatimonadaceae bacterium]